MVAIKTCCVFLLNLSDQKFPNLICPQNLFTKIENKKDFFLQFYRLSQWQMMKCIFYSNKTFVTVLNLLIIILLSAPVQQPKSQVENSHKITIKNIFSEFTSFLNLHSFKRSHIESTFININLFCSHTTRHGTKWKKWLRE